MRSNVTAQSLQRFMQEIGNRAETAGRVYFTGGATALLLGLRNQTIDLNIKMVETWEGVPGADLIAQGLSDLEAGKITEHSLLVLVGEPRLRRLGIRFAPYRPAFSGLVEHALYDLLGTVYGNDAYSRYNSMLRRMNSFAHALEREQAGSSSRLAKTD